MLLQGTTTAHFQKGIDRFESKIWLKAAKYVLILKLLATLRQVFITTQILKISDQEINYWRANMPTSYCNSNLLG